ncbi:hypothetical protein Dda_8164 [Drechslerella dactyloides]|uniref:RNA polymerase-associated protein LEO1 n=1 Tax=Drechslerella dactyloides TaxID=74499 RepID=A0AAD6NGC5_DREDA|nr:hypothetical protein Dda_8164 [Drechslerella dactyloides]
MSSSPMSDLSDRPPPRRRAVASDDDDDLRSDTPPAKPAAEPPLDEMFDDDDDDDAPKQRSRRQASPKDSDDGLQDDDDDDLGDDLFGDGSEPEAGGAKPKVRTLDDEELDSGDELDADPRRRVRDGLDDEMMSEDGRDETSYEVDIGLHKLPQPSDDQVYLLKIPQFISIAPQIFKPEKFEAPKLPPDAAITPYTFATTAIRWRRSPADPSKLESNSRIIQWNDGSFSLQIGSSKEGLYDLPTNMLVPPDDVEYNPAHDSFTFLAEPLANSRLVRFFTHATQGMGVVPASDSIITDDIKQMVAARYKATQKRRGEETPKQMELLYKIEDPERARREAEAAEKEIEKSRKKIEAQRNKEVESAGANGYRRRYRRDQALTLDELEEGGRERSRAGGGGYKGKKVHEDEYDEDDGFVEADPASDEEEEEIDDSDEEEEYESSRRREKKKKHKSKSKRREEEDDDDEPLAEFTDGEDEDDEPRERAKSPSKPKARSASEAGDDDDEEEGELSRAPERKRRRLVMEDSEEE